MYKHKKFGGTFSVVYMAYIMHEIHYGKVNHQYVQLVVTEIVYVDSSRGLTCFYY